MYPYCAGRLLQLDQDPAREVWTSLPQTLAPRKKPKRAAAPAPGLVPPNPPLTRDDWEMALTHARAIPHRVTPHELAQHPPLEAEPERAAERDERSSADNPAIRYGTWWHKLMEAVPWAEPADWDRAFAAALVASPQPDRARREWDIFRASPLARWLATPGLIIHRELPFLWPTPDRCLEGVMDLAVFSPVDASWRVLDWKTNRTDRAGLLAIYRGQVEAYVEALKVLLHRPVEGGLYLTATGEWIDLDASVAP